jgi:DNA polymerase elongation subunit (family B)
LNVWNSEGVQYEKPKIKIKGLETTRSSTPQVIRDELEEAIRLIINTDEKTVINYIKKCRQSFYKLKPEDAAFPRGCNGLDKYHHPTTVYRKSTPIAVRGSLLYNKLIDEMGLGTKYPKIREGDKVKFIYLQVPNPLGENIISFPTTLPKEFNLHNYIDYKMQFDKGYVAPLESIMEVVGWSTEERATLDAFM